MERMYCHYLTDPRPFATFQCPDCLLRLFLIEEKDDTPLLLWSSQTVLHSIYFTEYVQTVRKKRKEDREKRRLREAQAA